MKTLKTIYLDASAICSLILEEPSSAKIVAMVDDAGTWFTSALCLSEVINVLKRKWLKRSLTQLTQEEYFEKIYLLTAMLRERRITIRDLDLSNPDLYDETTEIAKKHNIDIADALQIATLKRTLTAFTGESSTRLISVDKHLVDSARAEGINAEYAG